MPKPGFIPNKHKPWIEVRKRFRLSHAQVQMARELGMNPKKLGKLANSDQEPWKIPLPQFIEMLYQKRFGKSAPDDCRSIEKREASNRTKKETRKKAKVAHSEKPIAFQCSTMSNSDIDQTLAIVLYEVIQFRHTAHFILVTVLMRVKMILHSPKAMMQKQAIFKSLQA